VQELARGDQFVQRLELGREHDVRGDERDYHPDRVVDNARPGTELRLAAQVDGLGARRGARWR
jgi:hypothetical protein